MTQKTACLRGYLEVVGGVLLKGPLMKRRDVSSFAQNRVQPTPLVFPLVSFYGKSVSTSLRRYKRKP